MWGVPPHFFYYRLMVPPDPFTQFIRDAVSGWGFELVDLRVTGPRSGRTVRIRMDRPGSTRGSGVTSEDCTTVARRLGPLFEAEWTEDAVATLEVSSPGIERPVRFPDAWRRFVGHQVRVRSALLPGRPTVAIVDVPDDGHVRLRLPDGGERTVALSDITEATLVVDWDRGVNS